MHRKIGREARTNYDFFGTYFRLSFSLVLFILCCRGCNHQGKKPTTAFIVHPKTISSKAVTTHNHRMSATTTSHYHHSSSNSCSTIHPSDLRQQIENLQALLAAASSWTATNNNSHMLGAGNHHITVQIRSCLRTIQSLLVRDDYDWHAGDEEQQEQLTQDLMALILTLEYECEDPSIAVMLMESVVPRATSILSSSPGITLTKDHLQRLFARVLYLIQEQQPQHSENNTTVDCLLELLNQHLTADRLAIDIFEEQDGDDSLSTTHHDAWDALQIVLDSHNIASENYSHKSQQEQQPHRLSLFQLWFLITNILEYCQTYLVGSPTGGGNWHAWIQRILWTKKNYHSPELLRQHVDEVWNRVEQFGMEVLDTALQLLEKQLKDEGIPVKTILQYTTLALDFVTLTVSDDNTFGSTQSFAGMSRSLWHSFGAFCLLHLEEQQQQQQQDRHENDSTTSDGRIAFPEECQMVATDALWRLTTLHYNDQNTLSPPLTKAADASMILSAILRMWKQHNSDSYCSSSFNNGDAITDMVTPPAPLEQEWVKRMMKQDKSIQHALQAALLSLAYLPNGTTEAEKLVAEWIWKQTHETIAMEQQDNEEEDPWQAFVQEQLMDLQQQLQHQQLERDYRTN